ncbi:hypothetical protein DYB34_001419 [Aphanomyces astaci]|uniref:VPS9 domain-containing protein n=1 Tax=Aphanomyces astaci TaxID=112090 RepID=A0A418BXC6_APHAT|nr:hypothetical protein DYB34_001419 [Aphanomyces astaci]
MTAARGGIGLNVGEKNAGDGIQPLANVSMNNTHMQLQTTSDSGVLRRVKTALTPMSLDAKLDHVIAVEDRIALEVAAYKQRLADIEWDANSSSTNLNLSSILRRKPSCRSSLVRVKLHVEAALHKRAIEVLRSSAEVDAVSFSLQWKDRLRRDSIYRTLFSQGKWLRTALSHVKSVPVSCMRRQSADEVHAAPEHHIRRLSLDETTKTHLHHSWSSLTHLLASAPLTSPHQDQPCPSYLAFELHLVTSRFDQTDLGMAFESHCCRSLNALASTTSFHTLVGQLARALADEHDVPPSHQPALLRLTRQMVHARLGAVFVAPVAAALERDQASWTQHASQSARARALHQLQEVGLPAASTLWLRRSVAALEALPYFMPDHTLDAFLGVISTLHEEVSASLARPAQSLSADIILPVLVALVLHSHAPFLIAQIHAMETLALTDGRDGGEAAYYVALVQSAIRHVTQVDG